MARWLRATPGLLLAFALACDSATPSTAEIVRVDVRHIALDERKSPVVVLEEADGDRQLLIWIGTAEARSIALQMEEIASPRPNTHDLARSVIRELEGEVVRVVVTELRDGTYYATLEVRSNGRVVELDSRPSDGIAIACTAHMLTIAGSRRGKT